MRNDDRDQIKKTISEYREAIFPAMLNKHYTHAALYMKCMIAGIPLELKLEAIEASEANLMSNENATDYAKGCSNGLILHCPQVSIRWRILFEWKYDIARIKKEVSTQTLPCYAFLAYQRFYHYFCLSLRHHDIK